MNEIAVIGSLNMDLVVRAPRMPEGGETLSGTSCQTIPGGKGANQAVAAARSGATVRMIGCVGKDSFGSLLLESLSAAGVGVQGVAALPEVPSGIANILVDDHGENRIIIVPGANSKVSMPYVNKQWKNIEHSTLVILQHEIPLKSVRTAIRKAHHAGIRVLLNPAPAYPIPDALWGSIDILVMNEGEAAAITGMSMTGREDALKMARGLVGRGVGTVIITLGARGAVLCTRSGNLYQPAFRVDVVDTTAAGDAFVGGYAAALVNGKSRKEALIYATAAAALTVTRLGAQSSIPTREEVDSFLASI